jgi:hypothetical protein
MSPQGEAQLLEQLRQKDEENARLRMQINLPEQKIDLLVKRVFGAAARSWMPRSCSCCWPRRNPAPKFRGLQH